MRFEQKCINRLKNILKQDKERLSVPMLNMIKSDIYMSLNSYFDIHPEDINLKYFIDENGYYALDIGIKCNRIKKINFFNK